MKRPLALIAALAITLPAQQPQAPTFRASSNLVIVHVFVRDSAGRPLTGIPKSAFAITEDGKPQTISVFEFENLTAAPTEPRPSGSVSATVAPTKPAPNPDLGPRRYQDRRLLALFFDFSSMPPPEQARALEAGQRFINEQLTPTDLVAILSYTTKLRTDAEFTADKDELLSVLRKFKIGDASELAAEGLTAEDIEADDAEAFSADETEFNVFNTDRKLSALESAARYLGAFPERKAIIYFSSGVGKTGVENLSQLRSTVNTALRSNVAFYPVDARGLVATPPGGDASVGATRGTGMFSGATQTRQRTRFNDQQETLDTLASDTGGKALLDSNDLTLGIRQAQSDLQSYYLLGYYSTNDGRDGRFRRVEVRLAGHPQAKLDYRKGFYAEKEFRAFNASDREKQLEDALMLGNPITDLPIALEVNQFRLGRERYFVPVAVKLPGSAIPLAKKGGAETTSFDFIAEIRDSKGRQVTTVRDEVKIQLKQENTGKLSRRSLLYDSGFTLGPGDYKLKLLVRENQTGRMGTFETALKIGTQSSTSMLPISSVVWSSQREPLSAAVGGTNDRRNVLERHPLVQNGLKLIPSITRVYREGQKLYVYAEVYDAARDSESRQPLVEASLALYNGKVKSFESAAATVTQYAARRDGIIAVMLEASLTGLRPGNYTCQLNLVDPLGHRFAFARAPLVLLPAAKP